MQLAKHLFIKWGQVRTGEEAEWGREFKLSHSIRNKPDSKCKRLMTAVLFEMSWQYLIKWIISVHLLKQLNAILLVYSFSLQQTCTMVITEKLWLLIIISIKIIKFDAQCVMQKQDNMDPGHLLTWS